MPETFKTKGALKFHLRIKHSKEIDQQQEDHEVMSEPETSERSLELNKKYPATCLSSELFSSPL